MKKFLVGGLLCIALNTIAQKWTAPYKTAPWSYETGISLGVMNGKTDVGRDLNYQGSKPSASVHFAAYNKEHFGIRAELTYGSLEGKDSWKEMDGTLKKIRNLSYKTSVTEAAVLFEIQPMNWWRWYKGEMPDITPYAVAGIGVFKFNPKTFFNGKWIELNPLHIEGQGFDEYPTRKQYKLTQVCFPTGIGVKYDYNWDFSLRLEFLYRFLLTDYLDDVSEARTDVSLYPKYMSTENATLAKQLYIRRWEIEPGNAKQTGPRGNQSRDGYLTFNIKACIALHRDWLW
jgi:hypothetical protein